VETIIHLAATLGTNIGILAIVLLCAVAVVLSCLSISGTWVVLGAAIVAMLIRGESPFPGWITIGVFAALSIAIEIAETMAGSWSVTKRGGSKLAGIAALLGGLVGLVLGVIIPIPIIGPILGMMVLSFSATFMVELWRLKRIEHAAHIAWGAVWARIWVIILKEGITLGMSAALLIGMVLSRLS